MPLTGSFLALAVGRIRRLARRIWIRTTLIALLAILSAATAIWLEPLVPAGLSERIDPGSVTRLLEIIAASMLTVTTFSLSIMVAARQSASTQSTPRAQRLVLEDTTTQTVIATFLGAFVFALVSLVLISASFYDARTIVVVLGFTIGVVGLVVLAILGWIDHLAELGGVAATADKVEAAATRAIRSRLRRPRLGARPLSPSRREIPAEAIAVAAPRTGYVEFIDIAALDSCGGRVFVLTGIGSFVAAGDTLCHVSGTPDTSGIAHAFSIAKSRGFDDDPRYGAIVLSEIAQRALSTGANDPGTAIDIIGRLVRVIAPFQDESRPEAQPPHPNVWIEPITGMDLMRDAFAPIARDGADSVEVQVVLQKALVRLAASDDPAMAQAARRESARALAFAEKGLALEEDIARVRARAPAARDEASVG